MTPAVHHDVMVVLGTLLFACGAGILIASLLIEAGRRHRRPAPPAQPAEPVEDSAAAIRSRTVYMVTRPDPGIDMDATAVLLRPYRGGRHAAR